MGETPEFMSCFGVDTRALQHYLGHRNIVHTLRYTELRSDRFDGFWKD
jgi:type 1 fimbriae regulatory protein FimB/type 1 fimbriae regulatory protein FimE